MVHVVVKRVTGSENKLEETQNEEYFNLARFDRCTICDYTEATGSAILGLNPGKNGKVRKHGNDLLCGACSEAITKASYDLRPPAEVDEDLVLLEE